MVTANCTVAAIPSWLDVATEITTRDDFGTPAEWTVGLIEFLRTLGVPAFLGFGLAGHFNLESGFGQHIQGFNLGGVRASKGWAEQYRTTRGKPAPWWRADRHGASECTYYRGYDTLTEFLTTWLMHYVPKPQPGAALPAPATSHPNYARTGWMFWHYDAGWFAAMLAEGYRGEDTRANPLPSITTWEDLTRTAGVMWTQKQLGVAVDGQAGTQTLDAIRAYRTRKGLPSAGVIDRATTEALERDHVAAPQLVVREVSSDTSSGFVKAIPAIVFAIVTYFASSRRRRR